MEYIRRQKIGRIRCIILDIDEAFDVLQRVQNELDIPEEILLEMEHEEFEETLTIFLDRQPSPNFVDKLFGAKEELAEE